MKKTLGKKIAANVPNYGGWIGFYGPGWHAYHGLIKLCLCGEINVLRNGMMDKFLNNYYLLRPLGGLVC